MSVTTSHFRPFNQSFTIHAVKSGCSFPLRTTASVHLVRSSRSAVQLSAQDEKSSGVHALPEIRSLRTRSKYGVDLRAYPGTHKNLRLAKLQVVSFVRFVRSLYQRATAAGTTSRPSWTYTYFLVLLWCINTTITKIGCNRRRLQPILILKYPKGKI